MAPTIDEIQLADDPTSWERLGFDVHEQTVQLGTVRIRLAGRDAGKGIVGWSLRELRGTELDGLPTSASQAPERAAAGAHPNGVSRIDHVVAMSAQLDLSVQRLRDAGLNLRRIREQPTPAGAPRQAFFRLGEAILEVVQEPPQALERLGRGAGDPAHFWGLALLSEEIEHTVAQLGEHVSEIRPAVQSGRSIATLRRSAGLAVPVAVMSPTPAG